MSRYVVMVLLMSHLHLFSSLPHHQPDSSNAKMIDVYEKIKKEDRECCKNTAVFCLGCSADLALCCLTYPCLLIGVAFANSPKNQVHLKRPEEMN